MYTFTHYDTITELEKFTFGYHGKKMILELHASEIMYTETKRTRPGFTVILTEQDPFTLERERVKVIAYTDYWDSKEHFNAYIKSYMNDELDSYI